MSILRGAFLVGFASFLALAPVNNAFADETVLWHGWMDFGSCNRVKWYTDDFGIRWPTNESVGQELSGDIYLARTVDEVIKNRLQTCVIKGVAAAGMSSLFTGGSSSWAVFKASFDACLTSDGLVDFISDNISIRTDTHCRW